MYAQSKDELRTFLEEFKLKPTDGIARFDAQVNILQKGYLKAIKSEVLIIAREGLATVNMIDFELDKLALPTLFDGNQFEFKFVPGKGLRITGKTGQKEFIVSISPYMR